MSPQKLVALAAVVVVLGAIASTSTLARSASPTPEARSEAVRGTASEAPQSACCFQNPAYTGTCRVEPAEDETCASILAYLNNPMADGKSYCGGTSVRQGWTQVSCEEDSGSNDR